MVVEFGGNARAIDKFNTFRTVYSESVVLDSSTWGDRLAAKLGLV